VVHPILAINRVLWGALLVSSVLFPTALAMVIREPAEPPNPVLLPVFAAIGVALLIMSRILPGQLMRQAIAGQRVKVQHTADPHAAMANYRGAAPTRRVIADRESALLIALRAQQTATIIALALSEGVGLLGFALGMALGFGLLQVAPFFAVSTLSMLTWFPTQSRAVRALERATGASLA